MDLDTALADFNYIYSGLNNMKKEIELLEKHREPDLVSSYLNNLIDFAGDAIEEVDKVGSLFDETKASAEEVAEKFGEKKSTKLKEILEPLNNFFKYFS